MEGKSDGIRPPLLSVMAGKSDDNRPPPLSEMAGKRDVSNHFHSRKWQEKGMYQTTSTLENGRKK
jgi:hypothetical protein